MLRKLNEIQATTEYPLVEYVFSLVESMDSITEVVNFLLDAIGDRYHFDAVIVKEVTGPTSVKCVYEWSSDGNVELINVENRYMDNIWDEWIEEIKNSERCVWIYHASDGECPLKVVRRDLLGSLIEIPFFKNDKYIGCVEFLDGKDKEREFDDITVNDLKQFGRIMTSYLLPLAELERNHERVHDFTSYDSITHLPRYEIFVNELNKMSKKIEGSVIELVSLDLSNFKYLNEKYGYIEGNRVLKMLATRFYEISDKIISCSRPYSDNFIIAVRSKGMEDFVLLNEILEQESSRFSEILGGIYFDSSIIMNAGVFFIEDSSCDIDYAIDCANIARKFAKNSKVEGGYRCLLYNKGMSLTIRKQSEYITSMNKGIAENEFYVQLQPQCTTDTFDITGAEALVRWKRDNSIVLYPDEFLPVFEKNGCIVKLDYYVFERIFEYIRSRMLASKKVVPVAVNVSAVHFKSTEILDIVSGLLKKYRIPADMIIFEMSEEVYVSDNRNVAVVINGLKDMGFKLYIDDFGKGVSSLNTLTKYPIDGIKLDRSFMKHELERNDKIIISCMVNLANRLNLEVLSEGVESEEQRTFLIMNQCPNMQGFYFSQAVDFDQFSYLLDNQ